MNSNNEIKILNKNSELYLPSVEFWIMDDLQLDVQRAMLYKLILLKGFLIWNSEYIAKVLRCSSRSIHRYVEELCSKGFITKITRSFGSRTRWVLIANYTVNGLREESEISKLISQGIDKLVALYDAGIRYKKPKK